MRVFKISGNILALIAIPLLGITAWLLTYNGVRGAIDSIFGVKTAHESTKLFVSYLNWACSALVGLGSMIPSATPIWNKLSFWGQALDNTIQYFFNNKIYYLDTAGELVKDSFKVIHEVEDIILQLYQIEYQSDEYVDKKTALTKRKIHSILSRLTVAESKLTQAADVLQDKTPTNPIDADKDRELDENIIKAKRDILLLYQNLNSIRRKQYEVNL